MKKFCIVLLSIFTLYSFPNNIRFNHFGTNDGLSNESSYKIVQDKEGFIWIGTYDGLDRFDGNSFKVYKSEIKDTNSIAGNMIMDVMIDNNGVLWVATNQGVCAYNKYLDCFEKKIKVGNLDKGYTKSCIQDHNGNYWFASGKFAYEVSPDYKLIQILNEDLDENWIGNTSILCILEDTEGTIWISTQERGIFSFDPKTKIKKSYSEQVTTKEFFSSIMDSNGNIWFGTNEDPYVYVFKEKKFYNLRSQDSPFNLPPNKISSVVEDKNGILWISNWGEGLTRFNVKENSYIRYTSDKNDKTGLNGGSFEYAYIDMEGNVWMVGQAAGLNVVYKNDRSFNIVKNLNESDAGIFTSPVTATSYDQDGFLWFGTDGGGLSMWNKATNSFTNYKYDPENPRSYGGTSVLTIFVDSKNNVWAGGYNSGLNLLDRVRQNFIVFKTNNPPPYTISGKDIRDITEAKDGKIWVATNGGGINIYDPETYSSEVINQENSGIASDYCLSLMIDDKDRVFIATYNGLSIYNPKDKSVKNFIEDKASPEGLSANWVYCVYQDKKGRYWVGTQLGLSLYNDTTQKFKTYLEDQGLTNNTVMAITEDNKGNLWISTNNGISEFNPEKEEFQNYNVDDGLPDNQFRMGSCIRTNDGFIFFGSNNGVLYFNPDEIEKNVTVPIIRLTNLYINTKLVVPGTSKILKKSIEYTDKIKLNHKENFLRFEFIALSYFQAGKNKYQYKLEGINDDWVDCGTNTYANYTNLRHGNYTFLVRATNNDGVPSEVRSIKIRIRPAWYNTILFYIILVFLVIYGIYKYIKARESQAKHDKEILERKIAEGEQVIKEKMQLVEAQQKEILDRDVREKEIRFHNEGIAKFSDIFSQKRKDVKELSTSLISELVKYIDASAGLVYVADDTDPDNIVLRVAGEYCYDSAKERKSEFLAGEGYVGTCFIEMKPIEILDLPTGYIVLNSGLGQTSLNYNIFVPVVQENICLAVIEVAALQNLPKYKTSFIEKIADNLSSVIAILKANEKMEKMLNDNITQSEILKAQEEELRQNMEEMLATQEDLKRQMENANITRQTLEKEKAFIDTLLKNANESIYFKDEQSRFLKASDSMARLFKVKSIEELYGKSDFDFFTEEHARPAFEDEMEIIKTGVPIINKIEKETHADGRITYVSTSKMPLYDHNKKIIGTFGISKDITDLKNMEMEINQHNEELQAQDEELRQNLEEMQAVQENLELQIQENRKVHEELSKEKYLMDALLNTIPEHVYFKDAESRFIKFSSSMLALFSLKDPNDLIGKSDFDFFDEAHAGPAFKDEQKIISSGEPIINKTEKEVKKDGSVSYVSTSKLPLYDEDHNIVGTFGISKDITDLVNMEIDIKQHNEELQAQDEELRQNLEEMQTIQETLENQIKENAKTQEKLEFENIMFTTLMDNITARITYKDSEARYIRINKTKSNALGLKDQLEVFGKTDMEVFGDTHTLERHTKEIEQIKAGASILHHEEYYKQKNGTEGWGDTNRIPLRNKEGEIVGGLVITWDITDKKNMQFQFEQIGILVSSFAKNVPVVLFKTDDKGNFNEIEGNGLALLKIKNIKNVSEKLVEMFPDIRDIVINENSKEIEETSGKIKFDKMELSYKTILVKSKAISKGYIGYILLTEL